PLISPPSLHDALPISAKLNPRRERQLTLTLLGRYHGKPFGASTSVIDPACGDGVFLRVAAERGEFPITSLCGVDIDETLIPVWRDRKSTRLNSSHQII